MMPVLPPITEDIPLSADIFLQKQKNDLPPQGKYGILKQEISGNSEWGICRAEEENNYETA